MRVLTTRELAYAIGVSESSVKRWADQGIIPASRTAGGHRRIPLSAAVRFVEKTRATVVHPEVLGLAPPPPSPAPADPTADLFTSLRDGDEPAVHELVNTLLRSGWNLAAVIDGPLRAALARIGELWKHEPEGLLIEHRATDIVVRALNAVRMSLPQTNSGLIAVGGAPSGDPYMVPSLAVATVLAAEGFSAVNFGPETPLESLARAANWLSPRLVWLSLTVGPVPRGLAERVHDLARTLGKSGIQLVVGGQAVTPNTFPALSNLRVFSTVSDLATYARAFRPQRLPRRSRRRLATPPKPD